ncbi:vWA domain-containing protein [Streptosporangium sp. H16]|uniref:vWA domain-containing protein n=1 Tax=Streptosporangium sp. H16 TaxID=3444184 RepID=UPI003F79F712
MSLIVLAVPAAIALWFLWGGGQGPSLAEATLTGTRQTAGTVCLDVAGDFSGSMRDSVGARDEALALLTPFMAREMRAGDLFASVRFAQSASLALPPTRAASLGEVRERPELPEEGEHTYFAPALKELDRAHGRAGTDCVKRVLVAITDGEFSDEMDVLVPLARRFDRIYLALPDRDRAYRPTFAYHRDLRTVVTRGFTDAEELGLLYGEALATATGQKLVSR